MTLSNNSMTSLDQIIHKASQIEATPALVDYWSKQFQMFLGLKFYFDESTGIGSIDLMEHLTGDKKDIDHQALQQTIAVLIRFLDAVTTDLDFRSIKLSVQKMDEFLKTTDTSSQIGADYIGGLIADFSYRASENLAHEKGVYPEFKDQPKQIRAVEYEMWTDGGDNYKNGQELSTMFDNGSIASSNWFLVPRRNYAILDFPSDLVFWDKWRDSYMNTSITTPETISIPVRDMSVEPMSDSEDMLNQIGQDISQDGAFVFDSEFKHSPNIAPTPEYTSEISPKIESKIIDFPDLDQIKADLAQVNAPEIEPEVPEFSFDGIDEKEDLESELIHEETSENKVPAYLERNAVVEVEPKIEAKIMEHQELILGELVKITNPDNHWFNQVYQVVDIDDSKVRLAGQNAELQNHIFDRSELEKQNLYQLLEDINKFESSHTDPEITVEHDHPICMAAALILNDQDQVLLTKGDQSGIPNTLINLNQIPEESILKYLQTNFSNLGQVSFRILDEVGSVMVAKNPNIFGSQNIIYNIFLITSSEAIDQNQIQFDDSKIAALEFVNQGEVPKDLMLVKIALDKHNRKQKMISEAVLAKMQDYEIEQKQVYNEHLNQEREVLRNELEEQIRSDMEAKMQVQMEDQILQKHEPQVESLADFKHDLVPLKLENEILEIEPAQVLESKPRANLAKFKVKLEHWIESDKFGNMALSLGYSARGIESVVLAESSLTNDVKSTINLILHLFNHLLDHGLNLQELLSGLNLQYGDNEIPVNQILSLILHAITSAPQKISDINEDWLA